MIEEIFKVPMGKLLPSYKSVPKHAFSAICVIKHEGEDPTKWIAILHPDAEHASWARIMTNDPVKLLRAMHAVSKIWHPSDDATAIAVAIADKSIPIDDPLFVKAEHHLRHGYDAEKLRVEVLMLEPTPDDIQKIVLGFKLAKTPISDPFTKAPEKKEHSPRETFSHVMGIGIGVKSLSLGI